MTTTFSLKQGETRTSSGPIQHPFNKPFFGTFFVTLPDPSIFDYSEIKANRKHFLAYAG